MKRTKIPGQVMLLLWSVAIVMFLGVVTQFYALVTVLLDEQRLIQPMMQDFYGNTLLPIAARQLAIVLVVVFALFKKNEAYLYIVSLLLLLVNGFSSLVLMRYGFSFMEILTIFLTVASGASLFVLHRMKRNSSGQAGNNQSLA